MKLSSNPLLSYPIDAKPITRDTQTPLLMCCRIVAPAILHTFNEVQIWLRNIYHIGLDVSILESIN